MNKLFILILFLSVSHFGQKISVETRSDEKTVTETYMRNEDEIKTIKVYLKDWSTYKFYFFKTYQTKNDVLDGVMIYYHKNGKLSGREFWKNDKKVGEVTYYSEKGNLSSLSYYDNNGLQQGIARNFHENGKLESKVSFKNGKGEGPFIEYFENGKIKTIGGYKESHKNGMWKYYYENGNLSRVIDIVMGCPHGKAILYYESGVVQAVGNYKRYPDRFICTYEDGLWKFFNKKGKLSETKIFKDAKLIEEKKIE